jgi:hypothetical protein
MFLVAWVAILYHSSVVNAWDKYRGPSFETGVSVLLTLRQQATGNMLPKN